MKRISSFFYKNSRPITTNISSHLVDGMFYFLLVIILCDNCISLAMITVCLMNYSRSSIKELKKMREYVAKYVQHGGTDNDDGEKNH
jgi:hypothetical protein